MRTTVNLDDTILKEAERLTGIRERPRLLNQALLTLVAHEKAKRLAALGGSEPGLNPVRRGVDTSIWVDHLRNGDPALVALLNENRVACHPFIIGELACGNLRQRAEILALLAGLPAGRTADNGEILDFLESNRLCGKGLGLVDVHLLASARLDGLKLWTRDRKLRSSAAELGLHA